MRGNWMTTAMLMLGMGLAGTALQAQQAASPAAAPNVQAQSGCMKHGAARLNLSPEQKKQLRELRVTARDKAAIIRNDQTLNAEQKQAKLHELRVSTREQMKSVLTPDQQKMIADRRAERKAKIAAKLGLTADQQTKLKDLFHSTREQRLTVLSNSSLSEDQKLAQLKQIREQAKTQLSTILTPDQLQKFREMRRMHHMRHQG